VPVTLIIKQFQNLPLTLIGPGEVKVDLADFDLKLQENLLSNLIFFKYLFLQKRLPSLFELLTRPQKMTVLTDFLMIFCQKSERGTTLPTPPLRQSTFHFPVAGRVECGGWRVRSRACFSRSF
jgi:hypothetical protein